MTDPRRDGLARAAVDGVERDLSLELGELVALLVDALTSLLAPVLHVLDLLLEQVALVRVLTSQLVQIGCNSVWRHQACTCISTDTVLPVTA